MVSEGTALLFVLEWFLSGFLVAAVGRAMGKGAGPVAPFISGVMGALVSVAFFRLAGAEIAAITGAFVWAGSIAAVYGIQLNKSMLIGIAVSVVCTFAAVLVHI